MYIKELLPLSTQQLRRLADAMEKNTDLLLKIDLSMGGQRYPLMLTIKQYEALKKGGSRIFTVHMSKTAISHLKKDGGIFPLLAMIPGLIAAAAPIIAKTAALGALGGAAAAGGSALIKKISGNGMRLTHGSGIRLRRGDGLRLKKK